MGFYSVRPYAGPYFFFRPGVSDLAHEWKSLFFYTFLPLFPPGRRRQLSLIKCATAAALARPSTRSQGRVVNKISLFLPPPLPQVFDVRILRVVFILMLDATPWARLRQVRPGRV